MSDRPRFSPLSLLFWLAVSFAPGAAGYAFKPDAWYRGLIKPDWNPPDWVPKPKPHRILEEITSRASGA